MKTIRVVKSWDWPNLARQTIAQDGLWEDWLFTEDPLESVDGVLVLNYLAKDLKVCCPSSNVWVLMQEPLAPSVNDWMSEGGELYQHVFTHHPSVIKNAIRSQPALPWHVGQSYAELQSTLPCSNEDVVCITSNVNVLAGHKRRLSFIHFLQNAEKNIVHLYGRGIRPIEDKWDVLYPASYGLAIENSRQKDYWTEKLSDCFLSWTLPIYDGCPNITDYFPEEALIIIDIDHPEQALDTLCGLAGSGEWQKRQNALEEARRLVLEKYQFYPWMSQQLSRVYTEEPAEFLVLKAWKPSLETRWRNFSTRWKSRIGL